MFPAFKALGARALQVDLDEGAEPVDRDGGCDDLDTFGDVEAFLADHAGEAQPKEISEGWKDRRQEIQRHQQSRRFGNQSSTASRKSCRIEMGELKKKTRCRKCGKLGHWARECRSNVASSSAKESTSSSSRPAVPADLVECSTVDEQISFVGAAGLISSPGWGVIDTGCGRTLIGSQTLDELNQELVSLGKSTAQEYSAINRFRSGNGQEETSVKAVRIPVAISGTQGVIDAAVISGQAPLLLGRPTLEKLQARLDFSSASMKMLSPEITTNMARNEAGQLLVNILDFKKKTCPSSPQQPSADATDQEPWVGTASRESEHEPKHVSTRKKIALQECRCLLAQLKSIDNAKKSKYQVAELFSPPRFTQEVEQHGGNGLAFDIKQGWDLLNPKLQDTVDRLLDKACPELLIACPTCTHSGGWENLNEYYRSPLERSQILRRNRARLQFCVKQIQGQLQRGGAFMLEHPWPSSIWNAPELRSLKRKYGVFRVDMCAFDLLCPEYIQKGTGLMVSDSKVPECLEASCRCPGTHEHRVVAGQLKSGQRLATL